MEPVARVQRGYPTNLWITQAKILFIIAVSSG